MNTGTPQYDTLGLLARPHVNIISKAQLEEVGVDEASRNIAGTSPWSFAEHQSDQFTRWEAVENHWRKTPEFAELRWLHIPEESTRVANFLTDGLTAMEMNLDSIAAVADHPGTDFVRIAGGSGVSMAFYGNYYVGSQP